MRNLWSNLEIEELKTHYPSSSKEEIAHVLFKRNWESIKSKAKELKIKRKLIETKSMWTKDELDLLKKMYPNFEKKEILKKNKEVLGDYSQ